MTIDHYSLVLSILALLLDAAVLLSIAGYFFSPAWRRKISAIPYFTWIECIGVLGTAATLGSLSYQFIYLAPVCLDCWWQRIFMYPIELIALVALLSKNKTYHLLTGILAGIGILFSADHYSEHFENYVLGNPNLVPCSPLPGEPLCGVAPTVTFGFITIPFLALTVFVAIIWLSYLAHRKSKESSI